MSTQASLPSDANGMITGTNVEVELEAVTEDDVVTGAPSHGTLELGSIAGAEVGIWELRGGTVTDTEIDEIFVVLSGSALIEFVEEDRTIEVGPGDVVRLVAGSRTRWTVEDHIRKVYIAES
ncbi:cupin domain-containing protein [Leucobacter luti]|uniref:cupin domain-containing protein n=1 Tax=Leucobacter luti TaxID=340320 RepID=UPI003D012136